MSRVTAASRLDADRATALPRNIPSSAASSSCPEVSSCGARYWHACHGVNGKSLPYCSRVGVGHRKRRGQLFF
jgi:hypothetical protein